MGPWPDPGRCPFTPEPDPPAAIRAVIAVELVASGHSNPEIAATLFISSKTVEANLTRIYRKLGIRGRVDLARHSISRQADKPPLRQRHMPGHRARFTRISATAVHLGLLAGAAIRARVIPDADSVTPR